MTSPRTSPRYLLALLLLVASGFGLAQGGGVPHTFESGDVISASEMNENFQTLHDLITTDALPTTCTSGDILAWDGEAWGCTTPPSGTTAPAAEELPTTCDTGDILGWDGEAWVCVTPASETDEPAAETQYLTIGGHAFNPRRITAPLVRFPNGGMCFGDSDVGSWGYASAPIQLPHGSRVTEVTVTYIDASGEQMFFEIHKYDHREYTEHDAKTVLANATSSGPTLEIQEWTTIIDETIDNRNYSYTVEVGSALDTCDSAHLLRAFITYELP